MNILKFLFKKQIKNESLVILNKDLNVCAIKYINNQVVPATRSWETEYEYVFNPTDVDANLMYAIMISNNTR